MFYWYKKVSDPKQRMFIFASEVTGFRHLYLKVIDLHIPSNEAAEQKVSDDSGEFFLLICLNMGIYV